MISRRIAAINKPVWSVASLTCTRARPLSYVGESFLPLRLLRRWRISALVEVSIFWWFCKFYFYNKSQSYLGFKIPMTPNCNSFKIMKKLLRRLKSVLADLRRPILTPFFLNRKHPDPKEFYTTEHWSGSWRNLSTFLRRAQKFSTFLTYKPI